MYFHSSPALQLLIILYVKGYEEIRLEGQLVVSTEGIKANENVTFQEVFSFLNCSAFDHQVGILNSQTRNLD